MTTNREDLNELHGSVQGCIPKDMWTCVWTWSCNKLFLILIWLHPKMQSYSKNLSIPIRFGERFVYRRSSPEDFFTAVSPRYAADDSQRWHVDDSPLRTAARLRFAFASKNRLDGIGEGRLRILKQTKKSNTSTLWHPLCEIFHTWDMVFTCFNYTMIESIL